MSRSTFMTRLRRRRDYSDVDRALRTASPSMQHELLAAASRQRLTQ